MTQNLIVGVDPHRKKNVMQFMDSQGQALGPPFRADNNRPGTKAFVQHLTEQLQAGCYRPDYSGTNKGGVGQSE